MPVSTASSDSRMALLSKTIENYSGYDHPESRPQSDLAIRKQLIKNIEVLIVQPNDQIRAADNNEQNRLDDLLKSTQRKLKTVCQSLSAPTYLNASYFSATQLPSHLTERIYTLERDMIEETEHINAEFSTLRAKPTERDLFEENFMHIKNFIDNINQYLFEREALILGEK